MAVEALRIDDDDLTFDVIPDLERSFATRFGDSELREVVTVGDLHRLILRQTDYSGGNRCGTSHTFHALRRAASGLGMVARTRPSASLAGLRGSPRTARRLLAQATGLEMPDPVLGRTASIGCLLAVVAMPLLYLFVGWWAAAGAVALAAILLKLDRGSWTGDWTTLGSLARSVAALNHAELAKRGAIHGQRTTWLALVTVLCGYSDAQPKDVEPNSRLLI